MQIPTEITFQGLDHSDAVAAAIDRWVARLEHVHDRIEGCAVVVSQPHKRHRNGSEFEITVRLEVPGPNITVSHVGNADVYISIADAFRAARRQVLDRLGMQRGFGGYSVNAAKHRAM